MKLKKILCGFLPLFLIFPLAGRAENYSMPSSEHVSPAAQSTLTVYIRGIRNNQGSIRIGLFNNRQGYEDKTPNSPQAFRRARLPIKNGVAIWRLEVPYGIYAIKLFHDEYNSGVLRKSFVGRPTEGVGFSNVSKLGNRAPDYDEVKFTLGQPQANINIHMINP